MKCRIVKLEQYDGRKATVYSAAFGNEAKSVYSSFVAEVYGTHKHELFDIDKRIRLISSKYGAREDFFKPAGHITDGVCSLRDKPKGRLRLYCIRYSNVILLLGGGGLKFTRTIQEDPKLDKIHTLMCKLSNEIDHRIRNGDIFYINDGMELAGELEFEI